MERQEFYLNYKERYNLDNIKWDYPKSATIKVNQHIFNVRVSLKGEIDQSILFYVCNGMVHYLDVDFFRKQMLDESDYEVTGFKRIEKGKLVAIEVPYKYLKHESLDWKNNNIEMEDNFKVDDIGLPIDKVDSLFNEIVDIPDLELFTGLDSNDLYKDTKSKLSVTPTRITETENGFNKFIDELFPNPKIIEESKDLTSKVNTITKTNDLTDKFMPYTRNPSHLVLPNPEKVGVNDDWDDEFQLFFKKKLSEIEELILIKSKEYVRNNNRLHNFEVGAKFTGQTRETVLYGFLLKHLVSLQDIVKDIELGKLPTKKLISEKTLDIIIYNIILHYSIEDKINSGVK